MKVLEKGNEIKAFEIEKTCTENGNEAWYGYGGCGAKVLISEDKIFVTTSTTLYFETIYHYTFTCPLCGAKTNFYSNELPTEVENKVMQLYIKNKE